MSCGSTASGINRYHVGYSLYLDRLCNTSGTISPEFFAVRVENNTARISVHSAWADSASTLLPEGSRNYTVELDPKRLGVCESRRSA